VTLPAADPPPAYFVALSAGPVGVTVTAVIEVVLLRRRQLHTLGEPGYRPAQEHRADDVGRGDHAEQKVAEGPHRGVPWFPAPLGLSAS